MAVRMYIYVVWVSFAGYSQKRDERFGGIAAYFIMLRKSLLDSYFQHGRR